MFCTELFWVTGLTLFKHVVIRVAGVQQLALAPAGFRTMSNIGSMLKLSVELLLIAFRS